MEVQCGGSSSSPPLSHLLGRFCYRCCCTENWCQFYKDSQNIIENWCRFVKDSQNGTENDVDCLRILKMAKSAAAAHVSLPVLLRPGTRSIHIKPPLPVIWHLEGFTFSETFRPQNSWFKTRFMNSICFRYVQPTIVVVKRMLCWARPLMILTKVSSFPGAEPQEVRWWVD